MKESLQLNQKQKLHQVLSPLQVQFVRVLEMNGPEIEDAVERELEENPALEVDSDTPPADSDDNTFNETAEDIQLADFRSEDDIPSYRFEAHNHSAEDRAFEPVAVQGGGSLMEQLNSQLAQTDLTDKQLRIAHIITGNLDDNGYMTRSINAIADDAAINEGIDTNPQEVKEVWEMVRTLEPTGVGAVDLRDCLLLQLKAKPQTQDVKVAREIVEHNFDLLSRMDFNKLRRALKVNEEQLRDAMGVIRSLDPKPGGASLPGESGEEKMRHITPDFIVENEGGVLNLIIPNRIPALQVEKSFADADVEISEATPERQAEAKAFIRSRREDAASFIKALGMRNETLSRVMSAIMKIQRQFFLTDDEHTLKPMILKDISELTGYDISVVSRATSGKYVATRQGIYPLKFFFSERPKENSDTSSHEVMAALKSLIDGENKKNPLSDEAIAESLKSQGYDIARRTVAKYREKAGIPVARLRRNV
ncbi:MAG: RNA polymerase factor sigma-54 [Bacteroidales bacterium]|nr:RNA polymerase factor sigma-54 [Bacteroidales bacterium]